MDAIREGMRKLATGGPTAQEPAGMAEPVVVHKEGPSTVEDVPGKPKSMMTHALETGSGALQSFAPLKKICQHVCAFHCYAHDASRHVRAHHFCSHVNDEMRQCVVYDSDKPNARLIGIEYIISRRLFEALPAEEKKYWHSHVYEVSSGMLVAPGVPGPAEDLAMSQIIDTYGKTWHTWQVDRGDTLPLGPAQLMMSYTADGTMDPVAWKARDADYNINSQDIARRRAKRLTDEGQKLPTPDPQADHPWHTGKAWQAHMAQCDFTKPPASRDMAGGTTSKTAHKQQ